MCCVALSYFPLRLIKFFVVVFSLGLIVIFISSPYCYRHVALTHCIGLLQPIINTFGLPMGSICLRIFLNGNFTVLILGQEFCIRADTWHSTDYSIRQWTSFSDKSETLHNNLPSIYFLLLIKDSTVSVLYQSS